MNNPLSETPSRRPKNFITRPLMPHEITVWNLIEDEMKHRHDWPPSEIEYLKFNLSNVADGFQRFYDSTIKKIRTFGQPK